MPRAFCQIGLTDINNSAAGQAGQAARQAKVICRHGLDQSQGSEHSSSNQTGPERPAARAPP